ncbi:MAG: hypothetical protein KGH72_04335 [Candidatus Micrarchaeota archaeon]|nr:hypothetical protein [Candidatus Micrarchaeota archaeon]
MGNKGNNRHIKRLAANKFVNVSRKTNAYLTKPNAGRFTIGSTIALITVLKEKLNVAANSREARMIIKGGGVLVNGKAIKEERYPLGFGDSIEFPKSGKIYLMQVGKRGVVSLSEVDVSKHERIFRVVGKYTAKGKKQMIRLHDGTNIACDKDLSVNDSVQLKDGKVEHVIKLGKGAKCLVINGVHASRTGTIKEIKPGTATRRATVEIESDGKKAETLLDNIMVIK